ncbi:MAG: restriction endonuclease subunit S, partial [Flavobacteriaceae bacterium]|nr:restriction endonuclease subunit S [Flavobacteriaceae bacterium]
TDIQWLGKIPDHWKLDRIKDKTLNVVGGDWGSDPESESKGENIVVLRVSDLDDIYFSYDDLTIRKIKESSIKNRKINENCLIIEKSGGGEKQLVGRVGYPKGLNVDAISSNFMAKIEFDNSVDLRFVNYMFSSLYTSKLNFPFVQQTTGIQNLNVGYYLKTKVAFPPKKEQIAIANYLDKACERIDKIIKIKEEQIKTTESIKKSQIYKLCTKGLIDDVKLKEVDGQYIKKIPSHWNFGKLKRGCKSIDTGGTPKSSESAYFIDGTIKWYAPDCFEESMILTKPKKLINKIALDDNEIKLYPENSVYFVGVGATAGKVGIIKEPSSCNQQINILQTNYKLIPEFLFYHLKIIEKEIIRFAQYTTLPILNQSKTGYIEICYPPINEQTEIVDRLNKIFSNTQKTKTILKDQIKT